MIVRRTFFPRLQYFPDHGHRIFKLIVHRGKGDEQTTARLYRTIQFTKKSIRILHVFGDINREHRIKLFVGKRQMFNISLDELDRIHPMRKKHCLCSRKTFLLNLDANHLTKMSGIHQRLRAISESDVQHALIFVQRKKFRVHPAAQYFTLEIRVFRLEVEHNGCPRTTDESALLR